MKQWFFFSIHMAVVRGIHSGRVKHATFVKGKSKSGLSKSQGNYIFTYGGKNSTDGMRTT